MAEVEAAFAAYKVKFPTKYPLHGGFKGLGYQFAEIVFNAFNVERRTNVWITGANGKLIRGQWDPNAKKALAVLADWFKKGYIDPEFYNLANNASSDAWKTGNGLVGAWAGSGDWVATPGSTSLQLMTNVPGAKVVPGPYPKVDKNGPLPLVGVYDPFLYQYTGFGKNLSKNRDQLHKVMQVCDLISNDRETRYLAYYGIEGKHYTIPEGEVATLPTPEYAAKSTAEKIATEGYGGYWDYTLGFVRGNVQLKAIDAAINKFFVDPNGLYGSKNIKLSLAPGAVNKAIEDEQGNDLSKFMASDTSLTWDNYIAPIIIGGKPLSYFDDQYQRYLKQGGEKEELYANKLFGKK